MSSKYVQRFIMDLVKKGIVNNMMGMFVFLQVIVYTPLINIRFPASSLMVMSELQKGASFDIMYTD
jgi:hypothetical protein